MLQHSLWEAFFEIFHEIFQWNISCYVSKTEIKKNIEMRGYPNPPIIPTYTGKVEKTLINSNQRFSMNTASIAQSAKMISSPATITLSDAHTSNSTNMIQLR